MAADLRATITVQEGLLYVGNPSWIELTVTNVTSSAVSVVNPDMGVPPAEINWLFSHETYQISVLLFFHLLTMAITTAAGEALPMVGPNPWVTPILLPRLLLNPGNAFTLRINLSDHFPLQQAGQYQMTLTYGDDQASARADTELVLAEHP